MKISVGAASDVGRVREGNEDAFIVNEPLFAVADGMGGHVAGDVASALAVQVITEGTADRELSPEMLEGLLARANEAIWTQAHSNDQLAGMGTTCTVLLIDGSKAHLAHVGDSRAYLLRAGRLSQLTDDHTLVARMVKEGRIRPEDADRHPQRNVITRALGVDESVPVDHVELDLQDGDRILLCSDGLTSMIGSTQIESILDSTDDPQEAADRLVAAANEAGGEDNITVLVVDVGAPGDRSRAAGASPSARTDTAPDSPTDQGAEHHRSWRRPLLKTLLVLVVVGVLGVVAARVALANSWFVGVNNEGLVTIYKGIPEDIAGLELKQEEVVTELALEDVPAFRHDQLTDGYKTGSLEEAQQYVANLERLSESFRQPEPARTPKRKGAG